MAAWHDRRVTASPLRAASAEAPDDSPRARILHAARQLLFESGYAALTMDALASELGMSKKTLYAHFAGKDAIVAAIIDGIEHALRGRLDTILGDKALSFTRKLHDVVITISAQYASHYPLLLRDLQRHAPALYRQIDALRNRLTPSVIGRLLHAGAAEGMVRKDIDADFAVQYFLQAVTGLVHPDRLEALGLTPSQAFEKAIEFFFSSVLTETGRRDFEKTRPRGASR
jgi:AcrR family transcriptional regulator